MCWCRCWWPSPAPRIEQAESAALAKAAEQSSEVQSLREDAQRRTEQLKQSRTRRRSSLPTPGSSWAISKTIRGDCGRSSRNMKRPTQTSIEWEMTAINNSPNPRRNWSNFNRNSERPSGNWMRRGEPRPGGPPRMPWSPMKAQTRRTAGRSTSNVSHSIVIQPEGVEFTVADFEGPRDRAIRWRLPCAAREYMLSQSSFDPKAGEPYPLLLVRPQGIAAYYAARAAMKSWGGDFGYELIDDNWKLSFQPPDARLAESLKQVSPRRGKTRNG